MLLRSKPHLSISLSEAIHIAISSLKMSAAIINTPLPVGTCKTMLNALKGNNTPHWYSVNYSDAQSRANKGYPTIGITSDHIVVIYPHGNTPTAVSDLYMSMSGYKCFNDKKITNAWTKDRLTKVKFYSWYEKE